MPASKPHVLLALVVRGVGSNPRSWKLVPDRNATWNFQAHLDVAKIAHEGAIDSLWLPDLPHMISPPTDAPLHVFDPQLLMAAIASVVPDIGVVPTVSSTYTHPYTVARNIASLDGISNGVAGVNVVASYNPRISQNYGDRDMPEYDERYRRADEYLDVLVRIGDSFRLNANWQDKPEAADWLFDPSGLSEINYEGKYFRVRGPTTIPRSPRGRPLLSTAGGSPQAVDLAIRRADVLYSAAVDLPASIAFAGQVRERAEALGRGKNAIRIIPGLTVILGSTEEEAVRKADELAALAGVPVDPVDRMAGLLSLDPASLHPDRPLTEEQLTIPSPNYKRPLGFFKSITEVARNGNLTIRQLAAEFPLGIGHKTMIGTPRHVAGTIAEWYRAGAADGFVLHAQDLPSDARIFVDEVIPLLRKEGIYPDGYEKESLRSRFGLASD